MGATANMCDFSIVSLPQNSSLYDALEVFNEGFGKIHTWLSLVICVIGTSSNLANILVLTRRSMRTAVNTILCAIASCDCVVMASNLVFITHYNVLAGCSAGDWSRGWAMFTYLHSQLTVGLRICRICQPLERDGTVQVIGHTSSIWLSVAMGHLRYSTLRSHGGRMRARKPEAEMVQAYVSIVAVLVGVTSLDIPNSLSYAIQEVPLRFLCGLNESLADNLTYGFVPGQSELSKEYNCLIYRAAFWISGLLFKVVPCVLLTTFLVVLVRILSEVKRRRQRLLGRSSNGGAPGGGPDGPKGTPKASKASQGKEESADRTTRMLIAVICVFLATELPQGLMALGSGLFSREFKDNVYNNVGDVMDALSLINSCATFVIYCSMSKQYRAEFARIFLPRTLLRRLCPCWRKDRGIGDEASSMMSENNPSVVPQRLLPRSPRNGRDARAAAASESERLVGTIEEDQEESASSPAHQPKSASLSTDPAPKPPSPPPSSKTATVTRKLTQSTHTPLISSISTTI